MTRRSRRAQAEVEAAVVRTRKVAAAAYLLGQAAKEAARKLNGDPARKPMTSCSDT